MRWAYLTPKHEWYNWIAWIAWIDYPKMCASTLAHPKPRTPSKWNCWNGSFVRCLASKDGMDLCWHALDVKNSHDFSSSLIMPINIGFYLWRQKQEFYIFRICCSPTKELKSLVSLCSAPKPGQKDYNGSCLFKGENGSLLYLICTKNIPKLVKFRSTFESPFSFGFLACPENSWDCYSCAYIGAISLQTKPLHTAQITP